MRLHRLRLVNFRQHADTEIAFGPGITGIVGPNGSGKTTLLEAMAWAIYGGQAARGDKESVRNLRAKPRSSVRRAGGGRGGPRVPRDALAARRRAVSGRHARRQRLEDGHREARARPGDVARRVLQHVLHRAEGAGGDVRLEAGGPAQVPGARPRLRAPGARPGARARAPQRARRRAPGAGGGGAPPRGARGPSRRGPANGGGGPPGPTGGSGRSRAWSGGWVSWATRRSGWRTPRRRSPRLKAGSRPPRRPSKRSAPRGCATARTPKLSGSPFASSIRK